MTEEDYKIDYVGVSESLAKKRGTTPADLWQNMERSPKSDREGVVLNALVALILLRLLLSITTLRKNLCWNGLSNFLSLVLSSIINTSFNFDYSPYFNNCLGV